MKRKVGKLILVFFIILSFGTTGFATSIEDLTQKQNELQNQKECILQVGDKIDTYILKFNPTDKRIALTVDASKVDGKETENTEE